MMKSVESLQGEVEFFPFHFSNFSAAFFTFLGLFVVTANIASMIYILKKLTISNVINSVALFETMINILGFTIMFVMSLLPLIIGSSLRTLSCETIVMIVGILFSTGNVELINSINSINSMVSLSHSLFYFRSCNFLHTVNFKIHHCQIWKGLQESNDGLCCFYLCPCDYCLQCYWNESFTNYWLL